MDIWTTISHQKCAEKIKGERMKKVFNVRSDEDFRRARKFFERGWSLKSRWAQRLRDLGCKVPTEELLQLSPVELSAMCDQLIERDFWAELGEEDDGDDEWKRKTAFASGPLRKSPTT